MTEEQEALMLAGIRSYKEDAGPSVVSRGKKHSATAQNMYGFVASIVSAGHPYVNCRHARQLAGGAADGMCEHLANLGLLEGPVRRWDTRSNRSCMVYIVKESLRVMQDELKVSSAA